MSRLDRETDPKILHQAIELLQHHNRALAEQIAKLLQELTEAKGESGFQQLRIEALEKRLAKLTKQVFGPSVDQRAEGKQGEGAGAEGNDKGAKGQDEKKKKRPGHGPTKQTKLA